MSGTIPAERPGRTRLDALTANVFERLSGRRGARIFHPHGVTVTGALEVERGPGIAGTALFRPGTRAPALVRLSRGLGLPVRFPDILGVAVRVVDAYGPGHHQDLLLATALAVEGARFVLLPARTFDSAGYSSLLPYRTGDDRYLVGASVTGGDGPLRTLDDVADACRAGTLRVVLRTAAPRQPWRDLATFHASGVLPRAEGEALRFDPWHTGADIQPDGPLQRWRVGAYRGSQRGRPDTLSIELEPDRSRPPP